MTNPVTVAARLTLDTSDFKKGSAETDAIGAQLDQKQAARAVQADAREASRQAAQEAKAQASAKRAEERAQASATKAAELAAKQEAKEQAAARRAEERTQASATKQAEIASRAAARAQKAAADEAANENRKSVQRAGQLQLQLNDVFTQLGSGTSPLTVAIQQGPQITQIYGGLGATLRAIPPVAAAAALAIGVVTGVLAVGVKNSLDSAERLRQYNIELQATGNIAATTSARLDDLVRAQATRPGAGRADTAAALGTFLGNSALESEEAVGRALAIARDLARVSGQELPAASATLNQGLDGTAAGARRLDQAYNILTASEHEQIRLLEEQGKKGDAATIVLAAMERRFKGLNEQGISPTAASLNQLGNAWTAFADKVTKSPVTQALMFGATQTLNGAAMLVGGPPGMPQATTNGPTPAEMQDLRKQLADAEGTVGRLREMRDNALPAARGYAEAELQKAEKRAADLRANVQYLQNQVQATAASAAEVGAATQATSGLAEQERRVKEQQELVAKLNTIVSQRRELEEKRGQVDAAIKGGGLSPEALKEAQAGLKQIDGQLYGLATSAEKLQRDLDLEKKLSALPPHLAALQRAYEATYKAAREAGDDHDAARKKGEEARANAAQAQATATAQQISLLGAEAQAALATAEAYGKSRAAGLRAQATGAARTAEEQGQIAPGTAGRVVQETLEKNASATVAAAAEKNRAYQEELSGLERLAAAEAVSAEAAREAERANRVAALAVELRAQAEASGSGAIAQAAERQIAAYDALSKKQLSLDRQRAGQQLNAQYDPDTNYSRLMAELGELQATGVLTARTVAEATKQYEQERLDASRSASDGMIAGLKRYADEATNAGRAAADGVQQGFRTMEDALVQFTTSGQINFSNFANSIIADLARVAIRQTITGPLAQATGSALGSFGSWFGNFFNGGGTTPTVGPGTGYTYHTGGDVGGIAPSRRLPASVWINAQRYHTGGEVLGHDEVPIIAKRRERVLTEDQAREWEAAGRGSAGGGRTEVHIHPPAETKARTRETDLGGGNTRVDVFFEKIEAALAENVARQRGPLTGAMQASFGLVPRGR